jgi:hypothetical protein
MQSIPILALTAGAAICLAPGPAGAQGFNVVDFSCTSGNTLGVNIDIRGLGNTDLCVVSSVSNALDCACVGGGSNCPTDANKQQSNTTTTAAEQVNSENGRVFTTLSVTPAPSSGQCTLSCPSGQRSTLIQYESTATFKVCALNANDECTPTYCDNKPLLASTSCGPIPVVVFAGRRESCVQLFQ